MPSAPKKLKSMPVYRDIQPKPMSLLSSKNISDSFVSNAGLSVNPRPAPVLVPPPIESSRLVLERVPESVSSSTVTTSLDAVSDPPLDLGTEITKLFIQDPQLAQTVFQSWMQASGFNSNSVCTTSANLITPGSLGSLVQQEGLQTSSFSSAVSSGQQFNKVSSQDVPFCSTSYQQAAWPVQNSISSQCSIPGLPFATHTSLPSGNINVQRNLSSTTALQQLIIDDLSTVILDVQHQAEPMAQELQPGLEGNNSLTQIAETLLVSFYGWTTLKD